MKVNPSAVLILWLCILGLLGGSFVSGLRAQILDDTTKQVYGPKTTSYFLERDILEDNGRLRIIDTTLNAFHQYNKVNGSRNFYQDLGSFGTALRPVFFQSPDRVGTRLGIDPYQAFAFGPDNVRYFDTKSPFTQAYYVQGTNADQSIDFVFSRNVNQYWNFGMHYIRLNSNRLFGGDNEEILADNISFTAFTGFYSKNKRYTFLYHYTHLNQPVEESGGVALDAALPNNGLFSFLESDANLGISAESWQTQNNHHIYHQYKLLGKGFTAFHVLDIQRHRNTYTEADIQGNLDFYPRVQNDVINYFDEDDVLDTLRVFNFSSEGVFEGNIYWQYQNRFGIKGKISGFNYIAYFRNQIYNWNSSYEGQNLIRLNQDSTILDTLKNLNLRVAEIENFLGGELFYEFNENSRLAAKAEFALGDNYLLEGTFYNRNLSLTFKSILYAPTLVQRQFTSNFFDWRRLFSNTLSNEFSGSIDFTFGKLRLNPFGSYKIVTNYIYFDENVQPQQTAEALQLLQIGLNLDYQWGRVKTVNNFIYTESLGADIFRVPRLFANSRVYCEDCLLKKLLQTQIGLEMHFKSAYFADSYMPVSKQFYLQNEFEVKAYPIVDVFFNMRIKNVRIFLKFIHLNERPDKGYETSPMYPGQPRSFIFGVNWMFFD
ncbi:MAG: putative porin [Microscillaceae bacterium]|nr:putative porin [Microscillaceae bacterium]